MPRAGVDFEPHKARGYSMFARPENYRLGQGLTALSLLFCLGLRPWAQSISGGDGKTR
ncbi:MAG: hypothetical protein KJ606_00415 [Chloroflexi bacterium]|nr:hypothetical protein [Chloroflexota bacterium]